MAQTRHLLVNWNGKGHIMLAWTCLAILAVASAEPQRLRQQTQVISSSQLPVNYQTLDQPIQTVQTLAQPIQYQTVNTLGLNSPYQTVQTLQSPYQTVQTLQTPYQTVRTIPVTTTVAQPQLIQNYQSLPVNTISQNYQSVPINTVSGVSYQPAQVRVGQVSPLRSQTYKTVVQKPVVQTVVQQQPITTTVVQQQPIQTLVQTQAVQPAINQLTIKQTTPQLRVQQVAAVAPKLRIQQTGATLNQYGVNYNQRYAAGQYGYQGIDPVAPQGLAILRQVQDVQADGSYAYAFETENGIKAQEEGRSINQGNQQANVVQGSYSYVSPDGTPITVNYIADENGFRAEGEHIPKPSEEILRSIEYLRSLPPRPEDAEGQYVPDANGY